jgi:hypothetical protein
MATAATNNGQQLRAVKAEQYAKEFKDAANEVMFNAAKLKSPIGKSSTYISSCQLMLIFRPLSLFYTHTHTLQTV